jgi:HK97 family phage prohead protease
MQKRNFEFKSLNVEIKSFDKIEGIFTGYAASFNQRDQVNDTITPEAFDPTIKAFNEGTLKKTIIVDYDHFKEVILAESITKISKDDYGLLVEFKVSEEARETYSDLFAKLVIAFETGKLFLSIQGYVIKSSLGDERWIKKAIANANDIITEFQLVRIAVTDQPIDTYAKMIEMKSKRGQESSMKLEEVDGEVSAIKFLTTHKSTMSNTTAKSLVLHLRNIWKKDVDNNNANTNFILNKSLGSEAADPEIVPDVAEYKLDLLQIGRYL